MEQNKTATFVIGSPIDLNTVKNSGSGKFPAEREAIFNQIAEQTDGDTVTKKTQAFIYASVKFNINSVINTLKTRYYGSIEDGKGYVETRKITAEQVPQAHKALFDAVKKDYTFNRKDDKGKDEKMLFYIVELNPIKEAK